MFGYVRPPLEILPQEEADRFRRAYCGLCHTLGERYGPAARMILNYDFTYLAILLSDPEEAAPCRRRCVSSPVRLRAYQPATAALELAADESVILAYWQLRDGVEDHGLWKGLGYRVSAAALRGGYRKAAVQVKDLQLVGLVYESVQGSDVPETECESDEPEDGEHSQQPEPVDYGLLAFEWVEANLQRLNSQSNEAVASGQSGFRIPAEELPHGDSWPAVCTELVRNGFASAAPLADGIQVEIKTE